MIDLKEIAEGISGFTASEVRKLKISCVSSVRVITWEIDPDNGNCIIYDILEMDVKGSAHSDVLNALKRSERHVGKQSDEFVVRYEFPGQNMFYLYEQCPRLVKKVDKEIKAREENIINKAIDLLNLLNKDQLETILDIVQDKLIKLA